MSKIIPVFWITGNYYDCNRTYQNIVSKLSNPNIIILNPGSSDDEADVGDIIKVLKSRDIFEDNNSRLIKIKGLPKDCNVLIDYLKYINDSNVVVIDGPIGYYNDRGTFVSAANTKFYKSVVDKGKVFKFDLDASSEDAAIKWIQNVVQFFDKNISLDSAKLLINTKGLNYDVLYSSIHTLSAYQTKKTITDQDIKDCCTSTFTKSIWDILEKIHSSQFEDGFTLSERFIDHVFTKTDSEIMSDLNTFLAALSQNFEFLTLCKEISPNYLNLDLISNKLNNIFKITKEDDEDKSEDKALKFSKNFCYYKINKDKNFEKAHSWPIARINESFIVINNIRLMLRTSLRSDYETKLYLSLMFLCLFGKFQKKHFDYIVARSQ